MADGLYIGIMSGTSVDSVDAALVHIIGDQCQYLGSASVAYSCGTRESLLSLNTHPSIQLSNYIRLDHDVACVFAQATLSLLKQTINSIIQHTDIGNATQVKDDSWCAITGA